MSGVKVYEVKVGEIVHQFQLSDEDVEKYPGAVEVKAGPAPADKSRKPSNKK